MAFNYDAASGKVTGDDNFSFDVGDAFKKQWAAQPQYAGVTADQAAGRQSGQQYVTNMALGLADDAYRKQFGSAGLLPGKGGVPISKLGMWLDEQGGRGTVGAGNSAWTQPQNALLSPEQKTGASMQQAITTPDQRQSQFNALQQGAPSQPAAGGFQEAPTPLISATDPESLGGARPGVGPGTPAPATGVGAGRSYPSNWNANNAPGLASGGEGTTFASNPETGASYETSPMYQWQLKQGEKSINRAMRARGRYNSSVGVNTLSNFYNQLGAAEADKQYNRTFDQQKLGLQAALAQAQAAGASGQQLAAIAQNFGNQSAGAATGYGRDIVGVQGKYADNAQKNALSQAAQNGDLQKWLATEQGKQWLTQGDNQASLFSTLAGLGIKGYEAYRAQR